MSFIKRTQSFFAKPKARLAGLWTAYFLFWGAIATFIPYVSLYYETVGLGGTQIGAINSVRALVSFISAIAIAFLSDVLRRRKLVFIVCVLGMIVTLAIFPFMASFITILPIMALYSAFQTPNIAILDQETLSILEDPKNYSKVRVGGSYGIGIITLAAGLLIDLPGISLSFIFVLHILLMLALLVLVLLLPDSEADTAGGDSPSVKDLRALFRIPGFALWLGMILLYGIGDASVINFLFLHVRAIGGSASLMGLMTAFSIAGQIIAFAVARRIKSRIGSRRIMIISFVLRTIWFVLIGINTNPLLVLPIHILSGASFAFIDAGSVAYINERVPGRIGTTAQALRSAILIRLSAALGSLVVGALFQRFGSGNMYLIMAVFSAVSMILAFILRQREHRRETAASE